MRVSCSRPRWEARFREFDASCQMTHISIISFWPRARARLSNFRQKRTPSDLDCIKLPTFINRALTVGGKLNRLGGETQFQNLAASSHTSRISIFRFPPKARASFPLVATHATFQVQNSRYNDPKRFYYKNLGYFDTFEGGWEIAACVHSRTMQYCSRPRWEAQIEDIDASCEISQSSIICFPPRTRARFLQVDCNVSWCAK